MPYILSVLSGVCSCRLSGENVALIVELPSLVRIRVRHYYCVVMDAPKGWNPSIQN